MSTVGDHGRDEGRTMTGAKPDSRLRSLRERLEALTEYRRAQEALRGALIWLSVSAFVLLAALAADAWWEFDATPRRVIAGIGALVTGAVFLWGVLRPLLRRVHPLAVARSVEDACPSLDTRLINAVQLADGAADPFQRVMIERSLGETALLIALVNNGGVFPWRRVRKAAVAAALLVLTVAVSAWAFPEAIGRSLRRYAQPSGDFADLDERTGFLVTPAGASVARGEDLTVQAEINGAIPAKVTLETRAGGAVTGVAMRFDRGRFKGVIPAVRTDGSYRVRAGDDASPWYRLEVRDRPALTECALVVTMPEYMGLPGARQTPPAAQTRVPAGAKATLTAKASPADARMTLLHDDRAVALATGSLEFSWTPFQSHGYRLPLRDRAGLSSREEAPRTLTVARDEAPRTAVITPAGDKTLAAGAEASLLVTISADDDWNLRAALLEYRVGEGEWWTAERTTFAEPTAHWRGALTLPLAKIAPRPGDEIALRARAFDGHPARPDGVASAIVRLRFESPKFQARAQWQNLNRVLKLLQDAVNAQRDNLAMTDLLVAGLEPAGSAAPFDAELGKRAHPDRAASKIHAAQGRIHQRLDDARALLQDAPVEHSRLRIGVQEALSNESQAALTTTKALAAISATGDRAANAARAEAALLRALETLLRRASEVADAVRAGETPPAEKPEEHDTRERDRADLLHRTEETLREFLQEQREILDATRELQDKPVDDFTDADKKKLEDLAIWESKWAAFLDDLIDDLSQLPEQDFSESTMREELVEVYEEVEKAANALTIENVEIAVPAEQAGLEKAEELEHNLERWLPQTRDNLAWSMEDPPADQEIPLVDLPEELEDIIGELLDDENKLEQMAEDTTSAWMDSIDEGAGWTAGDGPISNMSARGVTGNQMPNNSEVGGRSGEGRTGRSSGQFVEQEATGKGGRQTPTRATPDPYEQGEVRDSSTDPQGGATGGGKVSGLGGEGLRGPMPPPLRQEFRRLAGQQAMLRQQTERMRHELQRRRYPEYRMDEALSLMEQMERDLMAGRSSDFSKRKGELAPLLEAQQRLVAGQLAVDRERAAKIKRPLREALKQAAEEARPEGFASSIDEYYRRLAEEAASQ